MRIQSFMHRLRESEWIPKNAGQYALPGDCQIATLEPADLQRLPEVIYIRNKQDYLVGRVERELLLYLVRSERAALPLQILDAIRDGIIAVDAEGRIYYANEAYTTVLGVPLRRVLGRYIQKIEPGALLVRALEERTTQTSSKQMVSSVNKYVSLHAFPLWNGQTFSGAVSIFRDVTELHQLNREVRQMAGIVDEYSRRLQEYEVSMDLHLASRDREFQKLIRQSAMAARANISVLLSGELGVGKNVIAQYIHRCSPQREQPFLTVSCSAAAEDLLEEELLGKGEEPGKLELAQGGTLYLDEIGDMPSRTQAKLQRALEQKRGCRIISSSSQDLGGLVREKKFRQDLYFRISAITLHVPPLRERPDDIVQLANYFLNHYNEKHQKKLMLSAEAYEALRAYSWPGNVRELKNHIERLVILGDDTQPLPVIAPAETAKPAEKNAVSAGTLDKQVKAFEAQAIRAAISQCGGNRTQAMKELGISRRTFYRKCAELHICAEK